MSAVRVLVPVVCVALSACASSTSSTRRSRREAPPEPTAVEPPAPRCHVQERTLAPLSAHPRAAVIRPIGDDLAIAWSEHVGERDSVRVLVVDAHGAPRSPSVEVVDREATIAGPDVAVVDRGLSVSWSEPGGRFQRALDARGRARSDVVASSSPMPTSQPTPCGRDGAHLACATPHGPMQLPGDEEPVSAAPSGAVVSLGASGLRLWLDECR